MPEVATASDLLAVPAQGNQILAEDVPDTLDFSALSAMPAQAIGSREGFSDLVGPMETVIVVEGDGITEDEDDTGGMVGGGGSGVGSGGQGGGGAGGDGGGGDGGGGVAPSDPTRNNECGKDAAALDVLADILAATPTNFPGLAEQGAVIYRDADGNVMAGSIHIGTSQGVSPSAPYGVRVLDIMGQVHSHPLATSSGNSAVDSIYDQADRYPSPADWASIGAVANQILYQGGDPSQLSLYIIDSRGFMREFSYRDRAIYDVNVVSMIQANLPPPPLPDPLLTPACNG